MKYPVAVIQMNSQDDKTANVRTACRLIARAVRNGAKMVVLPEIFLFRGKIEGLSQLHDIWEDIPGPSTLPLFDLARKLGVTIVAGSIYEHSEHPNKAYNSSVIIGPQGELIDVYRKRNLFQANLNGQRICEADRFLPGKDAVSFQAGAFQFGMAICYDLRFPRIFAEYSSKGCHAVCCPSAFTYETGKDHWLVLLRARAIDNRCYILAPNQWGFDNQGMRHYGHSAIIDPWGKILALAEGSGNQILYSDLDNQLIVRYHQRLPRTGG